MEVMAVGQRRRRPKNQVTPLVKVLLLCLAVTGSCQVAAVSCVTFTSALDIAGDPGTGSSSCLPYNIEISAASTNVPLADASAGAVDLAPALDVAVVVDESGSVRSLCGFTLDCYFNEQDFAVELVTLLNEAFGFFDKGGTGVYIEYSRQVNTNSQYTNQADYIAGKTGGSYNRAVVRAFSVHRACLPGGTDTVHHSNSPNYQQRYCRFSFKKMENMTCHFVTHHRKNKMRN